MFARNLRAARERAGLTQAGLAKKLGMADEVYARYERRKMWPGLDKLCRLCDVLGCTVDALLGLDQPAPAAARPAPADDPLPVRRLMRQLRSAQPRTVRLVGQMLSELDSYSRAGSGTARAADERGATGDGEP